MRAVNPWSLPSLCTASARNCLKLARNLILTINKIIIVSAFSIAKWQHLAFDHIHLVKKIFKTSGLTRKQRYCKECQLE